MSKELRKGSTTAYPKAKFELRPSKIIPGQVGLFSLRTFHSGDVVVPHSNWDESRLIPWDEYEHIDPATQRQLLYFCYKTHEGIHAPQDINKLNIAYFVNHSCSPCIMCDNATGDYVAKRKIKVGEEFTIDVEALMEKPIFAFKCTCGSKRCRKIVRI